MSTGTIQNAALQIINTMKGDALQLGFTNSQGAALSKGDEVYLHTDGTVKLRSSGATRPLGVVVVGGADGERVTVRTYFTVVVDVVNTTGGTNNAGDALVPDGTKDSEGRPNYIAGVTGNYCCAIALNSVADDAVVRVGILDSMIILP